MSCLTELVGRESAKGPRELLALFGLVHTRLHGLVALPSCVESHQLIRVKLRGRQAHGTLHLLLALAVQLVSRLIAATVTSKTAASVLYPNELVVLVMVLQRLLVVA